MYARLPPRNVIQLTPFTSIIAFYLYYLLLPLIPHFTLYLIASLPSSVPCLGLKKGLQYVLCWARTHDLLIPSPTSCQLSHVELCFVVLLNHKFIYSKYLLLRMIIKIINIIAFDYNNLKNTIIIKYYA